MHDFNCTQASDMVFPLMAEKTKYLKENPKGVSEVCKQMEDLRNENLIVEDKDEGGFVVSFPELPGCITCGETVESAVANALDAKKAWLEAAIEDGIEIHEPDSLEK